MAVLEKLNPIVSGLLHIPDVRLRMAELNLEIGKRYADNATVDGTMFSTKPRQDIHVPSRPSSVRFACSFSKRGSL